MPNPLVHIQHHGAVRVVCLDDQEAKNALGPALKSALIAAVNDFYSDPTANVIVLTGNGDSFCAGGNIHGWRDRSPKATFEMLRAPHEMLRLLIEGQKLVVVAVNGIAVGAGFALAAAGDYVLASPSASFMAGFPAVGAVTDWGLAYTLPRAVGLNRAKELLLTNRRLKAAEAMHMGLVTEVTEPDQLMKRALEVASSLASGPGLALGMTKRLLHAGQEASLSNFLQQEALAQAVAFESADFDEGVAAFKEKRKPKFSGK